MNSLITSRERRISTLDGIKQHPFFSGVDWSGLRERKAPFVPALDSEIDAGYFDDVRLLSLLLSSLSPC